MTETLDMVPDSFEPLLPSPEPVPGYEGLLVTVTGATGLIGSHVIEVLKHSGARVRGILHRRPRTGSAGMMPDEVRSADLLVLEQALDAVEGSDVVLSCAGITGGVGLAGKDPVSFVGPATVIAMNTLHVCWQAKVPRIGYLSSTTVYPPLDRPAVEGDSQLPDPLYPLYRGIGESKRFMERLLAYYRDTTGIGTAIVRPSGAYGRADNFDEGTSHVLPAMIARALRLRTGEPFEVWGDGRDVRDLVHARDVARCLLLATVHPQADLKTGGATGGQQAGPFNASSGTGISTGDLARMVLDAVGVRADIVFRPDRPTALKTRLVSSAKAEAVLGWRPEISLRRGIADVVESRKRVLRGLPDWRSP